MSILTFRSTQSLSVIVYWGVKTKRKIPGLIQQSVVYLKGTVLKATTLLSKMTFNNAAATVFQLSITVYLIWVQDTLARVVMCFAICAFLSNQKTLIFQIFSARDYWTAFYDNDRNRSSDINWILSLLSAI